MALNSTSVIRRIESELGASIHVLEASGEDILKIVREEVLPLFSIYFPYLFKKVVHPVEDAVPGHDGWYYIKTDLEVLGLTKILTDNIESGAVGLRIVNYAGDPYDRQIEANFRSGTINPTLFEYHHPNMFEIFPKNNYFRGFLCEVKAIHPSHLQTIPPLLREEFMKACVIEVCKALYPIRHYFANMNTAFGSIELFMQKLEGAEDKREQLLQSWRENMLKNSNRKKIFVY
jgi:hypothetical protein